MDHLGLLSTKMEPTHSMPCDWQFRVNPRHIKRSYSTAICIITTPYLQVTPDIKTHTHGKCTRTQNTSDKADKLRQVYGSAILPIESTGVPPFLYWCQIRSIRVMYLIKKTMASTCRSVLELKPWMMRNNSTSITTALGGANNLDRSDLGGSGWAFHKPCATKHWSSQSRYCTDLEWPAGVGMGLNNSNIN